uniref:DUF1549 domain-containing protein n=1 Tax=Schlesneria paludicola TaxID=360056 RepID=A0A7C4QR63_9PLAN
MCHRSLRSGLLLTLLVSCQVAVSRADERVRFNRDIRPILSDKCFACHGPDGQKRQAGLRLDVREGALASGVIAPGKPESSELIRRITTTDPDEHMPPARSKLGDLTPAEVDLLQRWIAQGAEYEAHWAFIPLEPVVVPSVDAPTPIDAFIRAGLAKRGLRQQPEADRTTLIRRLSFDLTGLPPTPEEVTAFVNDSSAEAYERLVDRLLQSPHYGERMAVDWLDVARYADSYGFQVDRERSMWPWRDWVIRAFNRNLPFDQFVTWQLAGDLLPQPTDEQILATAFNRLHQQESEGGSVEEEYRVEYVCDRVQTFATAFLGLTFECARCHDHKFDPVSQAEFYQLFAFFQNIDEAGLYSYFTTSPPTPTLWLTDATARQRLDQLQREIAEQEQQLHLLREVKRPTFDPAAALDRLRRTELELPGELGRFAFDALDGGKFANAVRPDQPATLHGENKLVPGRSGNAVEFTGDDPVNLTIGNFHRHEPFSVSLWLKTPNFKQRAVVFHRSRAWTDAASRGYELLLEEGRLKWSLIHFWPGNAISLRTRDPIPLQQWVHVVVASDGSSRAAGLKLFVNGRPAEVEIVRDHLTKDITGGGGDHITLGERFRDRGFAGGQIDDFRVFHRELTALEALAAFDPSAAADICSRQVGQLNDTERELLFQYHLAVFDAEWKQQLERLQAARGALVQFAETIEEIMVMRELPEPKKAFVLARGEYDKPRQEVQAGTPAFLPPFPADAPRNRWGLARWLTDRRHPLTARVTVNRFWQSVFGRGLVKTAEDFGSQGARPVYPELLDWLALSFIDSGWDVKALMKTIVMSHTYRQRSLADPQTMADDPDNDWLARGPRFRLSAEMIRDNALFAAGLLNTAFGGPPVNPYEMSEAFKPAAPTGGDGVYRRSLYTNWRRTGPPPALLAFDAPRRAVCIARRERTDSPLQALILLNGTQYVEAARVLGTRLHRAANGEVHRMIDEGMLRCLSRLPDERERQILRRLYEEQLAYFQAHPAEADALLKIGRAPMDGSLPGPEAAAATLLAQALLNHDECVVKR